jgi:hypothetical protein
VTGASCVLIYLISWQYMLKILLVGKNKQWNTHHLLFL